jgi:sortase A
VTVSQARHPHVEGASESVATPEPGKPAAAKPAPAAAGTAAARKPNTVLRSFGVAVTLLATVLLAFVGYLYFLSGVQEARTQTTLYAKLQGELGQAIAPVGPTTPGAPVAILNIPAIGIHNTIVVEGTSPENLTEGPGLLRDSVLPGQAGISVIFGRRATFGAPFARLPQLTKGDIISAITGQGVSLYQVISVSSSARPVPFSQINNQLLLVTADSSLTPAHYVEVEAKLTSTAQQEPGGLPSIAPSEVALGRDAYALIPAMAWAIALAVVAFAGSFLSVRWARWPAWIAAIPILIAITWNLFQSLSALLPNLY